MNQQRSFRRRDGEPPLVIAHRGLSSRAPENTIAAIAAALDVGVPMVEVDVHLTADNQVVVIHDRTLQRTSTGNGAIRSYELAELEDVDAGSWFDAAFASERIPTLSQVLALLGPDAKLNIEIKSYRFHRIHPDLLVAPILQCVDEAGALARVLFTSFDAQVLEAVRRHKPAASVGFLPSWFTTLLRDPLQVVRTLGASAFICSRQEFRRAYLEHAHSLGTAVFVYTVNDEAEGQRLSDAGVDGLITDAADKLIRII